MAFLKNLNFKNFNTKTILVVNKTKEKYMNDPPELRLTHCDTLQAEINGHFSRGVCTYKAT